MSFFKNIKKFIELFTNSKKETHVNQLFIKTERVYNVSTNKHYGVYVSKEGHQSVDFRNRLNNVFMNNYFIIVYFKDDKNIDMLITNNEKEINDIMDKYAILVNKVVVADILYRRYYFEEKEIAEQFEFLIKDKLQKEIEREYLEYYQIKYVEKNNWIKQL